jgi:hypothetical protein
MAVPSPGPAQPASDPFAAYLLSVSDAATLAQAAITGLPPAPNRAPTPLAQLAQPVLAAASAAPLWAVPGVPLRADPATVARAAAAAIASATVGGDATDPTDEAAATASEAIVSDAVAALQPPTDTNPADAAGAAAAQGAAATPGGNALAGELAGYAIPAANGGGLPAVLSAGQAGEDPSSLATDATAKYMGAGFLGPAVGLSLDQTTGMDDIPAVNGVLGVYALAANTYSNPQGQAFAPPAGAGNGFQVPAANAPEAATLDLIG